MGRKRRISMLTATTTTSMFLPIRTSSLTKRMEDNRNRVVVSTTETTWQHNKGKPTESPEVHRIPPTRNVSFFAQPGILAAVIGGAVVGLLCAILLVMFIVYRMRKKDEGSYALDEPK